MSKVSANIGAGERRFSIPLEELTDPERNSLARRSALDEKGLHIRSHTAPLPSAPKEEEDGDIANTPYKAPFTFFLNFTSSIFSQL